MHATDDDGLIWVEEFHTQFAQGYASERAKRFWPPGVGVGASILCANAELITNVIRLCSQRW